MAAALSDLVHRIQASALDGPSIAAALSGALDVPAVLDHVVLGEAGSAHVPLYASAAFEVSLSCWRPGESTALHGHGNVQGAIRVLSGRASEIRIGLPDRRLEAGSVAVVEPNVVHQVSNEGPEPLYLLQIYAPPLPVEQPSGDDGRRVVIVGGGWSGAAVAIHLLEQGGADLHVTLVERDGGIGRGAAYGTHDPEHLLNVPAARMGVDPKQADEFLGYARAQGIPAEGRSLLPRRLYGDYVLDRLARTIIGASGRLRIARASVQGVRRDGDRWQVALSDGRTLPADDVVLASGHGPAYTPPPLRDASVPTVLGAGAPEALGQIGLHERLLLVGTGLTALDVLATLHRRGHPGPIDVVSLTGQWPHRHLTTVTWGGPPIEVDLATAPDTADGLAAWFDGLIAQGRAREIPWQAAVDAVRPHLPLLWGRLAPEERTRFLTAHRPQWERLRHRAPPTLIDAVREWEAAGWVRRTRGSVFGCAASGGGWDVTIGGEDSTSVVHVDRVVLCTGPSSDVRSFDAPWPELIEAGLVQPDAHGLGVLADARSQVTGVSGQTRGLWAVGGLLRPRDFESTAVPELAKQARALAEAILSA